MSVKARRPSRLVEAPLSELRLRLNLSIPEARRLTGFARPTIEKMMGVPEDPAEWNRMKEDKVVPINRDWDWFWVGDRPRIITQSIVDWQGRMAGSRVAS